MKSLKNKIWLGVLVILIFILFLQHLNGNNLDKFRVLDKKPYYSIMFDYTGKPNLPEMIGVIRPNIIGVKRLFAEKDYEFADNTSKEKSKTGGIIELKGKGKYRGTMKVKIYVYDGEIMRTLKGRKNSKKRNHINYFLKEYEGRFEYRLLDENDFDACLKLVEEWTSNKEENGQVDEEMEEELIGIKKLFNSFPVIKDKLKIAGIFIDGKLEAFTMGEYLNPNMALIHIEKANPSIRGLYPYINQQFLVNEFSDVEFVNREEDLGIEGLRKAKLSYHPVKFVEKYTVREV